MSANLIKKFQEERLSGQFRGRDREAFVRVYDENVKDIHRFIYFKVNNKEEANDLTSMVFLKTWNYVRERKLGPSRTLRALLYKIARNTIIDYYRESGHKLAVSLDDENSKIEIVDESTAPQDLIDQKADLELIKDKLMLLKEEYREVIVLRFINELSLSEIAIATNRSHGNVRVILHRALMALKKLVAEGNNKV